MTITREEFESWRANPVTEAVFAALAQLAEEAKRKWLTLSWEGGQADPLVLADLRARAEIISDVRDVTFEELESILDERKSERSFSNRVQGAGAAKAG